MNNSSVLLVTVISILLTLLLTEGYVSNHKVYSHITKKFGSISVEVGWLDEPSLAGNMNSVILQVQENSKPVLNAIGNITTLIKYGTLTKNLDFVPSETADGLYEAKTIPTRTGSSYSVVLNGAIGNQSVNSEIPLDNVQGKQIFAFPDSSAGDSSSPPGATLGSTIQSVLSQLSNTVENMQAGLNQTGMEVQNTKTSIGSFEKNLDKTYFLSLGSIGVGLVGIILGSFALSRKLRIP